MSETIQYPEYKRIMYPPRPKLSIPPDKIQDYEDKGYVGQLKFNGTRTLVEIRPGGNISLWTRHREPHKAYALSQAMKTDLLDLYNHNMDSTKTVVFDGELMHSKTKGLKDTLILFDILVCDSNYFIGMPMLQRSLILDDVCGNPNKHETETGRKIASQARIFFLDEKENVKFRYLDRVWLAETFCFNLTDVYKSRIDMEEIEGLVLKKPMAPLDRGFSENNNGDWLIRCRKEHKNYAF